MKPKVLLTMIGIGLLASTAVPALADEWLDKQLQMSDGYGEPPAVVTPRLGAAGRPGSVSNDAWLSGQLRISDGYGGQPAAVGARSGAAGRHGSDDTLFREMSKGSEGEGE